MLELIKNFEQNDFFIIISKRGDAGEWKSQYSWENGKDRVNMYVEVFNKHTHQVSQKAIYKNPQGRLYFKHNQAHLYQGIPNRHYLDEFKKPEKLNEAT